MFALVMHGMEPSVFLEGMRLSDLLSAHGRVTRIAVGTTCIKPIYDEGLQDLIEHLRHGTVTDAIASLGDGCQAVLVLNSSRNLAGSMRFRSIVKDRLPPEAPPVLYVDEFSASLLTDGRHELFDEMLAWAGKGLVPVPARSDRRVREVHGAIVGESIWVNGSVIGRVASEMPRIWKDDDGTIHFHGIELKEHGLEHAGDFDPMTAKVRTGLSSPASDSPRSRDRPKADRAAFIDHDAERGLRYAHDCLYAVTVGDDTTKNSSSLLYRFSVPVIGITDGDEDGICEEDLRFPGSVIFRVRPGCDDIVGEEVHAELFGGSETLEAPPPIAEMAESIRGIIAERLVSMRRESAREEDR